jgi:hypothetical protein
VRVSEGEVINIHTMRRSDEEGRRKGGVWWREVVELTSPNSKALLSKLDGVKSPCIINVKTSAVFKVGILITVILLFYSQISALLFLFLYCTVL